MSIYMPKPKNYEDKSRDSSSIVNSVLENTPKGEKTRYIECVQCGTELKISDNFCPECGHNKVMPKEEPQIDIEKTEKVREQGGKYLRIAMLQILILVIAILLDKFTGSFIISFLSPICLLLFLVFSVQGIVYLNQTVYVNKPFKVKGKNLGLGVGLATSVVYAIGMVILIGMMAFGMIHIMTCGVI